MKDTGDEKGKFLFLCFSAYGAKKRPYARELGYGRLEDGIMTLEISTPALLFPA